MSLPERFVSVCLVLISICTVASAGELDRSVSFNIPPQSLDRALEELGLQANLQVMLASDSAGRTNAPAVKGTYAVSAALAMLLRDTGLTYSVDNRTVVIAPAGVTFGEQKQSVSAAQGGGISRNDSNTAGPGAGNLRMAQAEQGPGTAPGAAGGSPQSAQGPTQLEEVLVQAQKKGEERLVDVPIPMTVVNTQQLMENNQTSLRDYYNTIPGLNIGPTAGLDYQLLIIRGVNTGTSFDPTVGVTLDDQPFGGFTNIGGGNQIPDVDPNDLDHIEVLRGPQGTLYGTNSMGGLIRYVTKDPTTEAFSGAVSAGGSAVKNGDQAGYSFRASANVPLSRALAIRVSGYTRQNPGYIDNPVTGVNGLNEGHESGGTLTAKWTLSDSVSLKVRALFQHSDIDGSPNVTIGLGDLQQTNPPGVGSETRNAQSYSAVLNAKLGGISLTSVTGYNIVEVHNSWDYTFGFGSFAQSPPFNAAYAPNFQSDRTRGLTQELRLTGSAGPNLEWLAGGFLADQKSADQGEFNAETSGGAIVGNLFGYQPDVSYHEYAAFASLTWHFTDQFDLQMGGRESHIRTQKIETDDGFLNGYSTVTTAYPVFAGNVFTYLFVPRFKLSPDVTIYARLSSGYRAGGSNGTGLPGAGTFKEQYSPDKTENYEVGLKADVLDHRLEIDTSFYYINFKNIQIETIDPKINISFVSNAGGAKSEGVEFSVTSRPLTGLTVGAWVDYDEAVLTQDTPVGTYGLAGFPLPFDTRWSGNVSAEESLPLGAGITGFIGATGSYVGERFGVFAGSATAPARQRYPSYTQINLHLGARSGPWTVRLFANNLADKRGLLGGGVGDFPPSEWVIIPPRTLGLNISRNF